MEDISRSTNKPGRKTTTKKAERWSWRDLMRAAEGSLPALASASRCSSVELLFASLVADRCQCGAPYHDRPRPGGPERCWTWTTDRAQKELVDLGGNLLLAPIEGLAESSKARVSHGICGPCIQKLYPQYAKKALMAAERQQNFVDLIRVCCGCGSVLVSKAKASK
jgi:hypothetical protein